MIVKNYGTALLVLKSLSCKARNAKILLKSFYGKTGLQGVFQRRNVFDQILYSNTPLVIRVKVVVNSRKGVIVWYSTSSIGGTGVLSAAAVTGTESENITTKTINSDNIFFISVLPFFNYNW